MRHTTRMILGEFLVLIFALGFLPGKGTAQVIGGGASGDQFGWAVAWAGDVNNDGHGDLLVGIPGADQGGSNAGQVYLYLGSSDGYPDAPDLILTGETGGDAFGYAVSSAGDVDDDGYDDFLVGAPERDTGGFNTGRVYLYLGGSSPNGVADKTMDGDLPQARFGAAVAGGFNFNGDNLSDFAVGAPGNTAVGVSAGQVKIYLGADANLAVEAFVFDGDQANWSLGYSVDPAGDLNKDGYDDVVAGAPQIFDQNAGRAVVWFGQESEQSIPERLVFSGENGGDEFGYDVSGAGDLDGDGDDELLVGAPLFGTDRGAVYLFDGGTSMNTQFDWKATGATGGDRLGTAVDGGLDVDGNGTPDLAAGAPGADDLGSSSGHVRVFYGSGNPSTSADTVWLPDAPVGSFEAGDEFGASVRLVASLDGREGAEIVAGAPEGNATGGSQTGYVNLFSNPPGDVPVRLLSLSVSEAAAGVKIRWQVTDAVEALGYRVEAIQNDLLLPLHEGWLPAEARSFTDTEFSGGERLFRLSALDRTGGVTLLGEVRYQPGPAGLALTAASQNPFMDSVRLRLTTPGGRVWAAVYDVEGRKVRTLLEGGHPAGSRIITWDGLDSRGHRTAPGLYVVYSRAAGQTATLKVIRAGGGR